MTGINEVAKEIHENAVAHGWWDEERGFPEILALIHSEVSEALEEYRLLRGNIPTLPNRWWWTATPSSPINSFVRRVNSDGTLGNGFAYYGSYGVRPVCVLKSEILKSYLNGENASEQAAGNAN